MTEEYKVGDKTVIAVLTHGKQRLNCYHCIFNELFENRQTCTKPAIISDCVDGRPFGKDVIYKLKSE